MTKNKFFPISLIILGSFLEILYYKYRFTMDGITDWLSIIIGIALTLLLALAVYKKMWSIVIVVSLYSILATSAGQSFSLSTNQKIEETENAQELFRHEEIKEIQDRIKYIDSEILNLNNQIKGTVTTLEDRGYWRTALAKTERRIDALTSERKEIYTRLKTLRLDTKTIDNKTISTNIYVFYHDLFGWSAKWFQFIMQTILSAFIAFMAPLGIITMQNKTKIIEPVKKKTYLNNYIKKWVRYNWLGIRTGNSESILPKPIFDKFVKDRGEVFSTEKYNHILKLAEKRKIVKDKKILITNELDAVKKLLTNK